jgi:phosphoglycolate phosphatase-like HAD superfamily hydrolase
MYSISASLSALLITILISRTNAFSTLISNKISRSATEMKMTGSNGITLEDVKAILFDIDGTLADSWKLGFDATQVVLESNGVPKITEEMYHEGCIYATPERLARHAGLKPDDADFEKLGNKWAQEFDDHYVGLVSLETAGFYKGMSSFLNDVPETVKFGALTNACVGYAHAVLKANSDENNSLYDRFGSIKGADNVPNPKPAPDGLLAVCEELSLKPEDCIYIGDSPTDGKAAQAAGMTAVGVLWGSHNEESLSKAPFSHLCQNIDELREVLNMVCSQK